MTPSVLSPFRWVQFLSERAPPIVFLLLASGPCLSGLQIVEGKIDWIKFLFAVFGELVMIIIITTTMTTMPREPKVNLVTFRRVLGLGVYA